MYLCVLNPTKSEVQSLKAKWGSKSQSGVTRKVDHINVIWTENLFCHWFCVSKTVSNQDVPKAKEEKSPKPEGVEKHPEPGLPTEKQDPTPYTPPEPEDPSETKLQDLVADAEDPVDNEARADLEPDIVHPSEVEQTEELDSPLRPAIQRETEVGNPDDDKVAQGTRDREASFGESAEGDMLEGLAISESQSGSSEEGNVQAEPEILPGSAGEESHGDAGAEHQISPEEGSTSERKEREHGGEEGAPDIAGREGADKTLAGPQEAELPSGTQDKGQEDIGKPERDVSGPDIMEGAWRVISNENYEEYLKACGELYCSLHMCRPRI